MSESAVTPSAQVVAREFVKQYYTMLNSAPQFLHRFYSHNSCFIHADDTHAVTGQAEIHKKIMSLNFNNCHSRICQVDSQSSVGDSVVIQVIGELSNADQPMRRFVQSFVLVPQSANKYYVHVDIFRYQDSMPVDNADEQEALENGEAVEPLPTASEEVISMTIDGNESELTGDLSNQQQERAHLQQQQQEQNEADTSSVEANTMDGTNGPVEEMSNEGIHVEAKIGGDNGEHDKVPAHEAPTTVLASAESKPVKLDEVIAEQALVEQPVPPSKPLSWAAMAKRNAGSMLQQSSASASNTSARPPVATPDQRSSDAAVSLPPRSNRSVATPSDDRGNSCNGRPMTNGSREVVDSGRRGNATSLVNVPDNQQIFVGNLPQHVTDRELIEFFEKFGPVLDFKISRKPGSSPANNNIGQKNFGFMAFESADTVQKVLEARPIYMGKLRLNIEEKKAKEELARERSGFQPHGSGSRPQSEIGSTFVRSTNGVRRGGSRDIRSDTRASASEESRVN